MKQLCGSSTKDILQVLQHKNWKEEWKAEKHPVSGHVFYINKESDLQNAMPSGSKTTAEFVGPCWHDHKKCDPDKVPRVWFDHFLNKVGVPEIKSDKIIPVIFVPPKTANLKNLRRTNEATTTETQRMNSSEASGAPHGFQRCDPRRPH